MANFQIKFIDLLYEERTATVEKSQYEYDLNRWENCIEITLEDTGTLMSFLMDKSTAIKFAKTLRTEINKLTEIENSNG